MDANKLERYVGHPQRVPATLFASGLSEPTTDEKVPVLGSLTEPRLRVFVCTRFGDGTSISRKSTTNWPRQHLPCSVDCPIGSSRVLARRQSWFPRSLHPFVHCLHNRPPVFSTSQKARLKMPPVVGTTSIQRPQEQGTGPSFYVRVLICVQRWVPS